MKGKENGLNHDSTFSAHTINYVCHSMRSMFRVLGVYNFDSGIVYVVVSQIFKKFHIMAILIKYYSIIQLCSSIL